MRVHNISKMMRPKLPKQWRHWCRLAGLAPVGNQWFARNHRNSWRWYYLVGKGHYWRVSCFGDFEIRESLRPRSNPFSISLPKTRDQFLEAVHALIKMKETNENLIN